MSGWVIDTNVISESRRPRPNANVTRWIAARSFVRLYLSEVTVAEIRQGIDGQADADRRADIARWLEHDLRPAFGRRILSVNEDVLYVCMGLLRDIRKRRQTIGLADALIAATAMHHGLIVASRDVRPFVATGCDVVNPWDASSPPA